MITIILNGDDKQLGSNTSITQLLENLDLSEKRLAVEVNQQIIPRSDFASFTLNEQDKVEIVQAIGGGLPNSMDWGNQEYVIKPNSDLP
ncbi:MAG: sulfur carrier protein ThiS [Gammaproteobacteria bacterium]|nr:MAG: sulfur carrier protein ThiS [Gammaproteobacteria bacterium]